MKTIEPKIELIKQVSKIEGVYKQIELAGRLSYKSEDKITETSAKDFVNRMMKMGHGGVLEHGTVYLKIPHAITISDYNNDIEEDYCDSIGEYENNPYSKSFKGRYSRSVEIGYTYDQIEYVTTNYRVLLQGDYETWDEAKANNYDKNWLDDLKYFCEPTGFHEKRVAVRFILGIDISRELNRHRVNSMLEQSTRYCNFSKDKFGSELNIMQPREFSKDEITSTFCGWTSTAYDETPKNIQSNAFRTMCHLIADENDELFNIIDTWLFAHLACEWSYMRLIKLGWKPEQARKVLNLDTQSELIHTAFVSDWKHFLGLRSPKYGAHGAHPDAAYLADLVYDKFKEEEIL